LSDHNAIYEGSNLYYLIKA